MEKPKEWVDWLDTKVLQKAVIVDDEDNILSLKRVEIGPAKRLGKEDLPGGSVGESDLNSKDSKPLIEAIKREIKEETGLDAFDVDSVFTDSWIFTKSVGEILGIAIGYKARVKGVKPNVVLSKERVGFKWNTKEESVKLDFGDDGGFHRSIVRKVNP